MSGHRETQFDEDRPTKRRLLVTGSREWRHSELMYARLSAFNPSEWEVMHGGARGADSFCDAVCLVLGLRTICFPPDYKKPSPQRYHDRNDAMLDKADSVIAFWDGKSRGTRSVIDKAKDRGIPVEVVHA